MVFIFLLISTIIEFQDGTYLGIDRDECSFLFTLFLLSGRGRGATFRRRGHHFVRTSVDYGNNFRTQQRALDDKLDDKFVVLLDVIWRLSQ